MAALRSIKTQSNPSECLQVGDLSVMQNEPTIFALFSPFGKLRYVDMKQNVTKQRSFSGYCFVAFHSTAHATAAKEALNGSEQFGRKLRICWSSGVEVISILSPTVQLMVNFKSKQVDKIPFEKTLRELVAHHTDIEIVDVAIRSLKIDLTNNGSFSGFGFVDLPLCIESVSTVKRLAHQLRNVYIQGVTFDLQVPKSMAAIDPALELSDEPSAREINATQMHIRSSLVVVELGISLTFACADDMRHITHPPAPTYFNHKTGSMSRSRSQSSVSSLGLHSEESSSSPMGGGSSRSVTPALSEASSPRYYHNGGGGGGSPRTGLPVDSPHHGGDQHHHQQQQQQWYSSPPQLSAPPNTLQHEEHHNQFPAQGFYPQVLQVPQNYNQQVIAPQSFGYMLVSTPPMYYHTPLSVPAAAVYGPPPPPQMVVMMPHSQQSAPSFQYALPHQGQQMHQRAVMSYPSYPGYQQQQLFPPAQQPLPQYSAAFYPPVAADPQSVRWAPSLPRPSQQQEMKVQQHYPALSSYHQQQASCYSQGQGGGEQSVGSSTTTTTYTAHRSAASRVSGVLREAHEM